MTKNQKQIYIGKSVKIWKKKQRSKLWKKVNDLEKKLKQQPKKSYIFWGRNQTCKWNISRASNGCTPSCQKTDLSTHTEVSLHFHPLPCSWACDCDVSSSWNAGVFFFFHLINCFSALRSKLSHISSMSLISYYLKIFQSYLWQLGIYQNGNFTLTYIYLITTCLL